MLKWVDGMALYCLVEFEIGNSFCQCCAAAAVCKTCEYQKGSDT